MTEHWEAIAENAQLRLWESNEEEHMSDEAARDELVEIHQLLDEILAVQDDHDARISKILARLKALEDAA